MGWGTRTTTSTLAAEAREAWQQGRTVFAPRLRTPYWAGTITGSVSGWAEMIEAVEACGWVLQHWAVSSGHWRKVAAYPLFRRP